MPLPPVHLANRTVIRIGGEDRRVFLQGLISNDINLCVPQHPIYAALLTPQGKFLHDLFIVDAGDSFLADCEAAHVADLLKRLSIYKLRAKVTLEDMTDNYQVWASLEDGPYLYTYTDPRLPGLGFRAIIEKDAAVAMPSGDFVIYDRHRLAFGVPDGSRDMLVAKSTLSEGNFDRLNGISWTKGCYVGQELTARMHYRGLAKKRLFPVQIEGDVPAPGDILHLDDEDIGDMRSHCETAGLALLNIEKAHIAIHQKIPLICDRARLYVSDYGGPGS